VGEGDEIKGFEIEGADRVDGAGDLLPIGADVLNGRTSDEAGDAGQALDSADSLLAGPEDEGVPVYAGVDDGETLFGADLVTDVDEEDEAGEAFVGDDEVGAATKGEDWEALPVGEGDGLEEFGLCGDAGEEAGGASDAEGSERGQGDVFF